MRPAARDRILRRWNAAAAWVAGQLAEIHRLDTACGPRQRDQAIRHTFDRPNPEDR